jgi:lipooligosaccharide transport system permease protein
VRHAAFGWDAGPDLAHLGALLLFAAIMWRLAIRAMERKLVT